MFIPLTDVHTSQPCFVAFTSIIRIAKRDDLGTAIDTSNCSLLVSETPKEIFDLITELQNVDDPQVCSLRIARLLANG